MVIDTPPVSMFTDAVVLGLVLTRCCSWRAPAATTKQMLRHTRDVLQRANVNVAGVVLNGVDLQSSKLATTARMVLARGERRAASHLWYDLWSYT